MLQVIKEIERNPEDKTQVNFVYANQSVDDIILKGELDKIAENNDNIKVCFALSCRLDTASTVIRSGLYLQSIDGFVF